LPDEPALVRRPLDRKAAFEVVCTGCGQRLGDGYHPTCPACGSMSDVVYDLSAVELRDSENPYERFVDLLPVADPSLLPDDMGYTPCERATRLGEAARLRSLYLKDETGLPTASTKDRMAAVALPYLYEHGVRAFATSSTGNSSSAYARALERIPETVMCIFTAEQFRDRVDLYGGDHVVDVVLEEATFVDAFAVAGAFAAERGISAERGFFNPGRREGLKTAWLEAVDQVPEPIDWYVQAVSSAMGVYGVYKAARELKDLGLLERLPRLLCVQQDTCAPMVSAWQAGSDRIRSEDVVRQPTGIAEAILRGDPSATYPHVRTMVAESGGTFVSVSEQEMRDARVALRELADIPSGFEGAAALAGAIKLREAGGISGAETVLVNVSGGERLVSAAGERTHRIAKSETGWDLAGVELPRRPLARGTRARAGG
jgi:threonine synthase